MPIKKRYIPLGDDNFFNWQGNFMDILTDKAEDWEVPAGTVTALTTLQTAYEPLYHKAQNKTTRTRADVLAHRQAREAYEKAIRKCAKSYLMNNPLVLDTDRTNLGLTVADKEPSPGAPITEAPIIGLKGLSGGEIEVRCRVDSDKTMCSMHPDANVVDYRYILAESGDVAPSKAADCPKGDSQPKAKFVLKVGEEYAGKRFYGFFRWLNNKRPRQEGPWSGIKTVIVP
jgi:hypothetical protein